MAIFKGAHSDYRGFSVVDVYEGDKCLCTISLHENAVTIISRHEKGEMSTTVNKDWPESIILKFNDKESEEK